MPQFAPNVALYSPTGAFIGSLPGTVAGVYIEQGIAISYGQRVRRVIRAVQLIASSIDETEKRSKHLNSRVLTYRDGLTVMPKRLANGTWVSNWNL